MNRERVRRLMEAGRMTRAGLAALEPHGVGRSAGSTRLVVPPDILEHLKRDPVVWRNFSRFPASYKRIDLSSRTVIPLTRSKHFSPRRGTHSGLAGSSPSI